jgi:hypothetical protein
MTDRNWVDGLRLKFEDFVDTFVVAGAKQEEVYDAIVAEIETLRKVYQHPAQDRPGAEAEEPSIDWPGAAP